ncbi:hypothetical protein [Mucilaginibacter antarcticus]|uniref:hypothetical protein n=1 Tax=Mucilaginibacter antarcticus TaxID=1855725 RepID=UPI00362BB0A0
MLKTSGIVTLLLLLSISLKVYSWTAFSGNANVRLLDLSASDTSLTAIHQAHFKGKVVYVDFGAPPAGHALMSLETLPSRSNQLLKTVQISHTSTYQAGIS